MKINTHRIKPPSPPGLWRSPLLALLMLLLLSVLFGCGRIAASSVEYDNADQYISGGATLNDPITSLQVDWLAGYVKIEVCDISGIRFSENANHELDELTSLHYYLKDGTLHIQFCAQGKLPINDLEKTLTVRVPYDSCPADISVSTVSADVSCKLGDLTNLEALSVSGKVDITCGDVVSLRTASTSGDVHVDACSVCDYNAEEMSGNIDASFDLQPGKLRILSTSGKIRLELPADAQFRLHIDKLEGNVISDFEYVEKDGVYTVGKGTGNYQISSVSGDISLQKEK